MRRSGLLITEVNNTRVQGGLVNNRVNASQFDMGVNVVEADGRRDLDRNQSRADEGDVYLGSANVTSADAAHAEGIRAALCNIRQASDSVTLDIFTSRTTCPGALPQEVAISPAEATSGEVVRGTEVVVEGVLTNEGTNYFTDRKLVVTGQGEQGGEIAVTVPAPLETARGGTSSDEASPEALSDILGKRVVLRGRVHKEMQKGVGLTDVLVVEELEVAE